MYIIITYAKIKSLSAKLRNWNISLIYLHHAEEFQFNGHLVTPSDLHNVNVDVFLL